MKQPSPGDTSRDEAVTDTLIHLLQTARQEQVRERGYQAALRRQDTETQMQLTAKINQYIAELSGIDQSITWRLIRPLQRLEARWRGLWQRATVAPDTFRGEVAVIIPCHNYGRYLPEAIESVLRQLHGATEIVVVDDASTDDTAEIARRFAPHGVQYVRGEWHDVSAARNTGSKITTSPFLLFLDADDTLPPDYIAQCVARMKDPAVAVVYGDMHHFGNENFYRFMPLFDRDRLGRENYISSHALLRRQVFDIVGGYRSIKHAHEDWDLYRRMLQEPWQAAKAATYVWYRVHGNSMLDRARKLPTWTYAFVTGLNKTPITIFTPFAGRAQIFDRYLAGLRALEIDPDHVHIHWFNTSPEPAFDAHLRAALTTLPFKQTTYTRAPLPELWHHTPDDLIKKRVSNEDNAQYYYELAVVSAYNYLLSTCTTEYILTLEDDIVPEPAAIAKMQQALQADVAAVVTHYPCQIRQHSTVWDYTATGNQMVQKRRSGITEVGGGGFGCSLFRTALLRQVPIYTEVMDTPPRWYDHVVFDRLRQLGLILCDWDINVEHLQTQRYVSAAAEKFNSK